MKAKKIVTLALAAAMISAASVSVAAGTLTDQSPNGQTEVKGVISGVPTPGDVTYEITIPDVVDFGELTSTNTPDDLYNDRSYTVKLDKVTGLEDGKVIQVYVRDENATVDNDQEFYLTNKGNESVKFTYDVYDVESADITVATQAVNSVNMQYSAGYELKAFKTEGETVNGTLRFDPAQLESYELAEIVGEYNGYMVFFSSVEDE